MMTTFNFDFNNATHATAFAQIMSIVQNANVPMQLHDTSVTPITSRKSEQKVYADAIDVQCKYIVDGKYVTYTLADGKYVGQSGVRKSLNARIKTNGATWDGERKAWAFSSKAKAEAFVKSDNALVTADEINAVRAKAQARAEKKANKGA